MVTGLPQARGLGADALWALLAAVAALGLACAAFGFWDADLRVPLVYGADGRLFLAFVATISRFGLWERSPLLGWPFGQGLEDYPQESHVTEVLQDRLLGLLFGEPGLVANVHVLASYPVIAASAYAALRWLGASRAPSLAVAVIYAFLPYHQVHWAHLSIVSYWSVPVACAFLVRQLDASTCCDLAARPGPERWFRRWPTRRNLGGLAIALLLGLTGGYYAAFFLILLAFGAVLAAIARRSPGPLLAGAALCTLTSALVVAFLIPSIALRLRQGPPALPVALRVPGEVDLYGLRPAQLVVPWAYHRLPALARVGQEMSFSPMTGESQSEWLGSLGAAAYLALLVAAAAALVAPRTDPLALAAARLGLLAVTSTLLGAAGGLGRALGILGLAQLRAWTRISVLIGFAALAFAALAASHLARRLVSRPARATLFTLLAASVPLAVWDQTPGLPLVSGAPAERAAWRVDKTFVALVEERFGPQAHVFQLPIVTFPENGPVAGMNDYDHLAGYVHSTTLSWSYGGVRGREADWQLALARRPLVEQVVGIAVVGFDALWLDRAGYGAQAEAMVTALERLLGRATLRGGLGARYEVFDLRDLARRGQRALGPEAEPARIALLHPPTLRYAKGFSGVSFDGSNLLVVAGRGHAALEVDGYARPGSTRTLRLTLDNVGAPATARVRGPGIDHTVSFQGTADLALTLPADGRSAQLEIDYAGPLVPRDVRHVHFVVRNAYVVPDGGLGSLVERLGLGTPR